MGHARKVWFVEDLDDLNPFLKWMDAHLTQPFDSLFPPAIPPKHTRPDSKQPGKKANKERLRTEREALRNKYSKSKSIGPNSPAIVQECPQTSE